MQTIFTIPLRYPKILLTQVFLFLFSSSYSQTTSYTAYAVFSDSARETNVLLGDFYFNAIDTTNITQLELKVGVNENDSSLLFQVIDFDNAATLPSNFSYERIGKDLRIGVVGNQASWTYFCEVRVKDLQGNWGQPTRFLVN